MILGFSARYFSISSFRRFSRCSCERQQGGEVIHAEVSKLLRDLLSYMLSILNFFLETLLTLLLRAAAGAGRWSIQSQQTAS